MTSLCRVFGNPIKQSKSPIIHQLFANQFDIDLHYDKCVNELTEFEQAVENFFDMQNAVGANVTLPFKERAFAMCTKLSSQAKRSGAVNTLIKQGGRFYGDNTDGRGLVWDLMRNDVRLNNASLLLIGAGGAARGVIPALLDSGIGKLTIYNRTMSRAEELIELFSSDSDIPISRYGDNFHFDVIVNATSLSLENKLPNIDNQVFSSQPVCYDMVYLDRPTRFMEYAINLGSKKAIDGIGMLVGQAAESFKAWFGHSPDLETVINKLRAH